MPLGKGLFEEMAAGMSGSERERPRMHLGGGGKPIPMKLFAIGDTDRTPPYCSNRICTARLIRLVIMRPLEEGLQTVTLAIKMQGSKRTLRSSEIDVGLTGTLDCELDLSLSLQWRTLRANKTEECATWENNRVEFICRDLIYYPHYLKRRTNHLYIMLQRRKRYKNRRILGYKTLAVGIIDMSDVLQRSFDQDLPMYASPKDKATIVARVAVVSIATQPVNLSNGKEMLEDENSSDDDEFTSEMSDSEDDVVGEDAVTHGEGSSKPRRKRSESGRHHHHSSQVNFKQKFISLLRKFKQSESGFDAEIPELEAHEKEVLDDELLDELEFDSDSGPEFFDNISLQSTPRPHLSPYFKPGRSSSTLLVPERGGPEKSSIERSTDEGSRNNSDSHPETMTDEDASTLRGDELKSDTKRKRAILLRETSLSTREKDARDKPDSKKTESVSQERKAVAKSDVAFRMGITEPGYKINQSIPVETAPRRAVMEQLNQLFPSSDEDLPQSVILVNGNHPLGQMLQERLNSVLPPAICTASTGDLKACFTHLASRLQKHHFNKPHSALRIVLCGGDEFVNAVLRSYVDFFADRPVDLQSSLSFVIVPITEGGVGRFLVQTDLLAASLFDNPHWTSAMDQLDSDNVDWDMVIDRVRAYVQAANVQVNLPIAQAMINFKSHGNADSDSPQQFVPFLSDVRIKLASSSHSEGFGHVASNSDLDDLAPHLTGGSASTASLTNYMMGSTQAAIEKDFSPPHSPVIHPPGSSPQAPYGPFPASSMPSSSGGGSSGTSSSGSSDAQELQLDFWMHGGSWDSNDKEQREKERKRSDANKPKDMPSTKTSIKAAFKSIYVVRPVQGSAVFSMTYATKEKKIQIMRALGKKSTKESEVRTVSIEGVSRLICGTTKSHGPGMKVTIDGCDWHNINFFQLSPQWHTVIKHLPVLISS